MIDARRWTGVLLLLSLLYRACQGVAWEPGFLDDLLVRVAEFAGREPGDFRQVGVNEYRVGAGIGWNKDKREFGIVVGVSLGAAATMRFRRAQGEGWRRVSHVVRPRSIYVLDGEARTVWEHSIPAVEVLRSSITFRHAYKYYVAA